VKKRKEARGEPPMINLWNSPGVLNFCCIATAYGARILLGCKVRETRNTIQFSLKHNKPLQYKQEVQMPLHGTSTIYKTFKVSFNGQVAWATSWGTSCDLLKPARGRALDVVLSLSTT
jgi:hypothetical protein